MLSSSKESDFDFNIECVEIFWKMIAIIGLIFEFI